MINITETGERRKNRRFFTKQGVLAGLRDNPSKVGQIVDVSLEGLSFCYMADNTQPGESSELDIVLVGESFQLNNLPSRIIWDRAVNEKIDFSSITMMRIGVKFEKLTPEQRGQLSYFIKNYTAGNA
jgi:hypothetical protein